MRTNFKKRLAVFLTILFVLPTILEVLPQTATVTQAASKTQMYWSVMYTGPGYGKYFCRDRKSILYR